MTVDAVHPELDAALQKYRFRLNLRVLLGQALLGAVAASPSAVVWAVTGWGPGRGLVSWFVTLLGGAVISVALRWRRRLSPVAVAAWMDEAAGTKGVFTAAHECLGRESSPATRRVLLEADRWLPRVVGPLAPTLPWRRVALRGGLLVAVLAVGTVGLLSFERLLPGLVATADVEAAGRPGSEPALPPGHPDALSPHDAARQLFPEDERLAALAEQALASGDPSALDDLLKQTGEARADQQTPVPGAPRETPSPGAETSEGGGSPSADPQPSGRDQDSAAPGQSSSGDTAQDSDSAAGPPGSPGGSPRQGGSGGAEDRSDAGTAGAGTGHSTAPNGVLPPGTTAGQLTLREPLVRGFFEYVLPNAESRVPWGEALADARRSSERALERSALPLEFAATVRQYFLSLDQEVAP